MKITIKDDFDLEKIIASGQCFRAYRQNDGAYYFITGGNSISIMECSDGTFIVDCTEHEWENIWFDYFDLSRNYALVRAAVYPKDYSMQRMAEYGKGIRILKQEPWETLVTFIISQRKSIPAIKKSVKNLCTMVGAKLSGGTAYSFPSPTAILNMTSEELKSCGLGYRTDFVIDAADKAVSGLIDLHSLDNATDVALLETLKSIKGVGDKVANCVGLFAYNRVDCAPVDVWINRIIENIYQGQNPFTKYEHNAGIYQQYMFFFAKHKDEALWGKA